MKTTYKILILLFSLTIYSCQNQPTKEEPTILKPTPEDYKPYFQFDKVDHYFLDIGMGDANDLATKENQTEKERRQSQLITGWAPDKLEDSVLVKDLEKFDFVKTDIPSDSLEELNQIFHEKKQQQWEGLACTAIYRDILVFKKHNQIVGIVKLCFHCQQHVIIGTTSDTDQFGLADEFEKLYFLLHGKNLHDYLQSGPK
ncbi:hypothetical protein BH10BAC1_BH10BAC1_02660 [soil metagenome]